MADLRYRGGLLPTAANPSFPGGGFVGESQAEILTLARRHIPQWIAPFVTIDRLPCDPAAAADASLDALVAAALAKLAAADLALPVVAKPDLGCRGAGVRLVKTPARLGAYLAEFPAGARLLLQELVPFEGEAGVFYCRHPAWPSGEILSLTLKYFPYVYGDGSSSLRELILRDPRAGKLSHLYFTRHAQHLCSVPAVGTAVRLAFAGSHSRGAIFRNGAELITPAMTACFEALANALPEFYFGRFDIRFKDFAPVPAGQGFTIVEINGAGAESTHIWDRNTSLSTAWRDLMTQYRLLFAIGRANVNRGFKPQGIREFLRWRRREKDLTPRYPTTD